MYQSLGLRPPISKLEGVWWTVGQREGKELGVGFSKLELSKRGTIDGEGLGPKVAEFFCLVSP